jgi:hypothetical protein
MDHHSSKCKYCFSIFTPPDMLPATLGFTHDLSSSTAGPNSCADVSWYVMLQGGVSMAGMVTPIHTASGAESRRQ